MNKRKFDEEEINPQTQQQEIPLSFVASLNPTTQLPTENLISTTQIPQPSAPTNNCIYHHVPGSTVCSHCSSKSSTSTQNSQPIYYSSEQLQKMRQSYLEDLWNDDNDFAYKTIVESRRFDPQYSAEYSSDLKPDSDLSFFLDFTF